LAKRLPESSGPRLERLLRRLKSDVLKHASDFRRETSQLNLQNLLVAAGVLFAAGCGVESKPATEDAFVWQQLGSWTGRGSQQTESFIGETGSLRVRWETRNEAPPGHGTFQVAVHSAISGRPLAVAGESRGVGHGISYINEDPRVFYLVVESANLEWSVTVEEGLAVTSNVQRKLHDTGR